MATCRRFVGDSAIGSSRAWCDAPATHVAFGNAGPGEGYYCEAHAPAGALLVAVYDLAQSRYVAEVGRLASSGRGRGVSNSVADKVWRRILKEVSQ